MRGAHHAFDCMALSLITPPNFGSGAGSCLPSIVVVAPGEPGVPVICCATARGVLSTNRNETPINRRIRFDDLSIMVGSIHQAARRHCFSPALIRIDTFVLLPFRSGVNRAPLATRAG